MIELEKLSECKGPARFGDCSCCGVKSQDNDTLIRIKASYDESSITSICLCSECIPMFIHALMKPEE